MLKFIKRLFIAEPEVAAPDNLVLFTPSRTSWNVKTVNKLFHAGLGRLHIQPQREWKIKDYENFLKQVPLSLIHI